ncbi:MAG TPA: hypothetical protein PKW30_04800 [Campylobacterales bacterium]|nr:hypothetical protein [Campylobacterales bacterium]
MSYDPNTGEFKLDGDFSDTLTGTATTPPKLDTTGWSDSMGVSKSLDKLALSPEPKGFFDKAFETPGATIGGIGALVSGVGALYGAKMTKDYQNKILKMEEDRVNTNKERQAKQQAAFDKVWN